MPKMPSDLASTYPLPWNFDGEHVVADNGRRVWDVADANDNPQLAMWIVAVVNSAIQAR